MNDIFCHQNGLKKAPDFYSSPSEPTPVTIILEPPGSKHIARGHWTILCPSRIRMSSPSLETWWTLLEPRPHTYMWPWLSTATPAGDTSALFVYVNKTSPFATDRATTASLLASETYSVCWVLSVVKYSGNLKRGLPNLSYRKWDRGAPANVNTFTIGGVLVQGLQEMASLFPSVVTPHTSDSTSNELSNSIHTAS
ncbi:hypothetical protein MAR_015077 [Mya arenaria]|uniref:Uncharacterized protein n=1 Tax=Mya arenaria TaxID=6604 RepID=A0ABY7FG00_MYAAR|nr:hypothetical protein MAR_015077 [Mya arenaria]